MEEMNKFAVGSRMHGYMEKFVPYPFLKRNGTWQKRAYSVFNQQLYYISTKKNPKIQMIDLRSAIVYRNSDEDREKLFLIFPLQDKILTLRCPSVQVCKLWYKEIRKCIYFHTVMRRKEKKELRKKREEK